MDFKRDRTKHFSREELMAIGTLNTPELLDVAQAYITRSLS